MDWQELLQFLIGSSMFSGAFGWIGKAAVDAYLKGRLVEHKADLDRIATEHSVRFQRLHSERADIIKDLPKSGGSGECIMKSNIATSPTHHSGLRFQILEGSKGVVGEILKS